MRNGTAGTDEEVQQGPLSQDGRGENSDHDAAEAALREARLLRSEVALERALERSRLPELARRRIAKRLSGEVLGEEEIREAIEDERDYLARLHPARVHGLGQERGGDGQVVVGAGRLDRLQAALDRACGLEIEDPALRAVRPLGLRGLYNEITLGHDPEIRGTLSEAAQAEMLREAFTNATLPRVVANTLHRRMTRDYRAFDYGERRIVSSVGSAGDFRTQEAVRVGYFGDIPAVDPEAADYAELAAYGEESATYTVGQRGAIVTITRKHILNDDIGHVARVVGRLGRAARRTFARFVWDFVVDNPPIYDGVAWFAAGHNNLLAAALDQAGLNAAEQLLFNQTELSSGEKLGLAPQLLVVPIELKPTAWALNASGTSDNDNPWRGRFGANGENILVNPFFADANDWAVFADPREADIVEVKFLNGREEPELFLADSPTVGQMFTADKLQYKIRHEYGGAVVDYRSAVKSVVV